MWLTTKRDERARAVFNDFMTAVASGDYEGVKTRLSQGDPATPRLDGRGGFASIIFSAAKGMAGGIKAAPRPNLAMSQDDKGHTALMLAASIGNADIVSTLLPLSDPMDKDNGGMTALMGAARNGYADIVKALLPLSDPKDKDEEGWTALMFAAVYGHAHCISALLPLSDPMALNKNGRTALILAAKNHHDDCVKAIEAHLFMARDENIASKRDQRHDRAELMAAPKVRKAIG